MKRWYCGICETFTDDPVWEHDMGYVCGECDSPVEKRHPCIACQNALPVCDDHWVVCEIELIRVGGQAIDANYPRGGSWDQVREAFL